MAQPFQRSHEGRGDTSEADALLPNPDRKSGSMDDDQLASIIAAQERAANGSTRSQLSTDRARSMDYYLGRPFGNEVEGRSQVVSTDTFDVIEGMLPSLLEIFLSSNRLAECDPNGPEDEAEARQQTEVANYVLLKQNNAALLFYTWFKDALLQKTGVVKTYHAQEDEVRTEKWSGLTDAERMGILSRDEVEPVENIQREMQIVGPDGQTQTIVVHDLTARVHTKKDLIRVMNIPPENFFISVRQNSLDLTDCEFASHKERKTVTDLLEMGVEQSFLDGCGDDPNEIDTSQEKIARDQYSDIIARDVSNEDASMRELWVSDAYIVIDYNGDGVGELRHVIKIGNKVWLNEETDVMPFSVICPILLPHEFFGLSVADITADVQFTKSVLWRQMLDNLYLTNNPRYGVLTDQVNYDDLLTSRPGGIVRMNVPGAVTPFETPFVAQSSFPMLEYMDSVRETRTGITKYNQGLDANSLNKTAHGINAILGQSMKRLEMIARLFAETGIKDLVRKVLHCVSASGMKQMTLRLTNGYVNVDPREWKNQFNVTINVGLGTGTKDKQIAMLQMIQQQQVMMMQAGKGYMVSEQNMFATASKIAEAAGYKSPEVFFTPPDMVPPQAKVPPPNPEMVKLQTEAQLKQADMQATTQAKAASLQNDRAIVQMQEQIRSETQKAIAQLNAQTQIALANIQADTTKRVKMADATMKDHEMRGNAEMELFRKQAELVQPAETAQIMAGAVDQSMAKIVQALVDSQKQTAEALQAVGAAVQQFSTFAKAPRKRIKDKDGRMVGVEIEGFGQVPVQ